jgi:hypothetical protein
MLVDAPFLQLVLQIRQVPELGGLDGTFKGFAVHDPGSENHFGTITVPWRIVDTLVVRFKLAGRILICRRKDILCNPDQRLVNLLALPATWFGVLSPALMSSGKIQFKTNLPLLMVDEGVFWPDVPAHMKPLNKLSCVWRWLRGGWHQFTQLP